MVIQVLLKDPRSGSETKYQFDQSPVRIGRNPLNNVVLDGNFVSGWHGTIRFDSTGTYYFDLGSTNGTCIDGKRLPKNVAIPLQQTTRLTIWMYELIVTPGTAQGQSVVPVHQTGAGTLVGVRAGDALQAGAHPPSAFPGQGPGAWGASSGAPIAATRPVPGSVDSFASREAAPRSADTQMADRLVRCLRIIGAFSEAFIGLKKGYEQFGSEVGVRPVSGTTPLHRARTGQEIIEYLLDPDKDPDACARDLNAVFADMGIHDVALMEGISQSVRGLLEKLDPKILDFKLGAGLWSGSRAKAKWNAYVEAFDNLLAEDAALHAEIFGEEFARAYASVALGNENDSRPDDKGDRDDGR
jgi:predicted component of type VI protein secretion system